MKDKLINLTDGTKLTVNINFGTIYHIQKSHITQLMEKYKDDNEEMSDDDSMEASARIIHAILLSNGRNVSFNEALCLVPADADEIKLLINEFKEKLEKYKKKEKAKQGMKQQMK